MNSKLQELQPYPFEKLRQLFKGVTPPAELSPIHLEIGEPKHSTPSFIKEAICLHVNELAHYPTTQGSLALREAISQWLTKRYGITIDYTNAILPVNGSREALFSFTQTVINNQAANPLVICPNPFYQIYEGAALLAGAAPYFINTTEENHFLPDYRSIPESVWRHTQLVFVCSPGNPTGATLDLKAWQTLFDLSDRYHFIIAADECYSEIYFDNHPPLGALEAAYQLGRRTFPRLISFSSLSKRSNVPGMRSGFVAGDAQLIRDFLRYRTYHGSAMSPMIQAASKLAWSDETHVEKNRALYQQKFDQIVPLLGSIFDVSLPQAGFYLWAKINKSWGMTDTTFAQQLYAHTHVSVLPGSFLAREVHGINPGQHYIRIALVASLDDCLEAARRIVCFIEQLTHHTSLPA